MLGNIKIIYFMVLVNFYGLMVSIIVENIMKELKMVLEFLFGILINLMLILDFGKMGKRMVLVLKWI